MMNDALNADPIIDWTLCLKMSNGDEEGAKELLHLLLQSIPAEFDLIQKCYDDKNYQELADQVHRFHGGLCYTGLPQLKTATKELERIAKQRADSELDAAFRTFSEEMTKALEKAAQLGLIKKD